MGEEGAEKASFSVRVFKVTDEAVEREEVLGEAHSNEEVQVKVWRRGEEEQLVLLLSSAQGKTQLLTVQDCDGVALFTLPVTMEKDSCRVGSQSFLVTTGNLSVLIQFRNSKEMQLFFNQLKRRHEEGNQPGDTGRDRGGARGGAGEGAGSTGGRKAKEDSSASHNVQFHGCLAQQQNMLQDYLRTATHQKAVLLNEVDFRDRVVLVVGSGSGILPFFAVQAGARRVYVVAASPSAKYAQALVQSNKLSDRVVVLEGQLEEMSWPERVDVILSEPIGYMLLGERALLENFLFARKWLKPNGLMFPSSSDIHLAPFTDEQLYIEHYARASFWHQRCFYGVNLGSLHSEAVDEFYKQPIVDTFEINILMAKSVKHCLNFMEAKEEDIHRIEIPFVFDLLQSGLVHGLAFWFDTAFLGSKSSVWLSTAPTEPLTHWYQVRCLLQTPLFAKLGQTLSGTVLLTANNRQSYDITITAVVDQSGFRSGNTLDLKNLFFRVPSWLPGW
ncbi:histone-arginine methyltransferase CARM1 [Aplochiton taeniatus]